MIKVKRLFDDAILPTRGTKDSAGLDLYATEDITLSSGSTKLVGTGISLNFPNIVMAKIESRSGLASKGVFSTGGIIDSDFYPGEIKVILNNQSKKQHKIKKGDRIAQIVLYPIWITDPVETNDIPVLSDDNERKGKGFGSSGT